MKLLIKNALLINEGQRTKASVIVSGNRIEKILRGELTLSPEMSFDRVIDAEGMILLPGVIDDQVHFREPGLTHKGDIAMESAAAVAGGVTSYMDMPNTKPPTTTIELLEEKYQRAAETSLANYSFYFGASNENADTIRNLDPLKVCGVKLFMGSSTGNMLVDNREVLRRIFNESPVLVAVHAEKEEVVKRNIELYRQKFGDAVPVEYHPLIRSEEACYRSSAEAVELATMITHARLHILHLSTAKELTLLSNKPLSEKQVTAEVCVHHLWFDDRDYAAHGTRIKWNPAIKTEADKLALQEATRSGVIDIVATDHAPHLLSEKEGGALTAASGGPLIQYSLLLMLEMVERGVFALEDVVTRMCHAPADLFAIKERGYVKEGYFADLVLVEPGGTTEVTASTILSKCGWSPFEGTTFRNRIRITIVNGVVVYDEGQIVSPSFRGERLTFNR